MNQNNQVKRLLMMGIPMMILFLVCAVFQSQLAGKEEVISRTVSEAFGVSLSSGFYNESQTITVTVPKGATVYYTDDCSEPSRENGKVYSDAIDIAAYDEETVYTYRFKAFYEDGSESKVINRTYFCGAGIDTRYTTNVLHIAGDPDGLFGYENGIFVNGEDFDEYVAKYPGRAYIGGVDANFTRRGEEYEREVFMEYFTQDGESLMAQECGVRIYGAMSRMKNQKSFRLYARKEYDEQNEFDYPAITHLYSAVDGTLAQEHKRLIVRNSGNDNGFGFIRSELTARLAGEAGFPDVMHADPVTVYINGIYYGVYWLSNGFDDQYFTNRYGEYSGEFVILEGGDTEKLEDEDPVVQKHVEDYNEKYAQFAAMDMTVEENFTELQKFLDVENYLQYFAIENYIGNIDWPSNNLRAYRYISPDGVYEEGTVFDGRYRHMLFDLDYAFGVMLYNGTTGTYPEKYTLQELMDSGECPLFVKLMERQDCRDYFVSYTCDLLSDAMSPRNVERTLEEMHLSRYDELYHMLEETDIMHNSLWDWEPSASLYFDNVEYNYDTILEYADRHPQATWEDMTITFKYAWEDWYDLYVGKCCRSDIQINTIYMDEDAFQGTYIGSIPVVLTPVMDTNEVFDYWMVNEEIRTEEELTLTTKDIVDGFVNVQLVVHEAEEPVLRINAVRAKGQEDYIEVINLSDKDIQTRGYYLSDSEDAYRYPLPSSVLAPGETKRYYGRDNMNMEVLGQNGMNFNLREGETITLTYREELLEKIMIPDLLENGIYQRDEDTGKFVEVLEIAEEVLTEEGE